MIAWHGQEVALRTVERINNSLISRRKLAALIAAAMLLGPDGHDSQPAFLGAAALLLIYHGWRYAAAITQPPLTTSHSCHYATCHARTTRLRRRAKCLVLPLFDKRPATSTCRDASHPGRW